MEEEDAHRSKKRRKRVEDSTESQETVDFLRLSHHESFIRRFFCTEDSFVPHGGIEWRKFENFYERYVDNMGRVFRRESEEKRRSERGVARRMVCESQAKLHISVRFPRWTKTLETSSARSIDLILKRHDVQSIDSVDLFVNALVMYEDFRQKRNVQKLVEIHTKRKELPIAKYETLLLDVISNHQVVVVAGDTGCGKSSQLPQYLLRANYSKIACTQPRRISAMALARRVSLETMNEYGSKVAYQIRFDTSKTEETRILFLTEGVLLRQVLQDPELMMYDVIIVDEVHERHITGDFLLGILRTVLMKRPDLKLILMSATINTELFSSFFWGAPIVNVPGRVFPIEMEYIPLDEYINTRDEDDARYGKKRRPRRDFGSGERIEDDERLFIVSKRDSSSRKQMVQSSNNLGLDARPYLDIIQRIDQEIASTERGDMLIFVPGMREIDFLAKEIGEYARKTRRWIVLRLHSQLSVEEQDLVFDNPPDDVRKCVISTNIAESSLTIDGIRFVVDSGKVKEMAFDETKRMMSLQEFFISQASAQQRAGRAGRTGPGVCYRLYSKAEYEHFLPYDIPEILRTPLDGTVLQILSMGFENVWQFPFLEKPSEQTIHSTLHRLQTLGALDQLSGEVTPLGRVLNVLPVDVSIGKLLVLGTVFDVLENVMTIAAGMSIQSPFLRIPDGATGARDLRASLVNMNGDPFTVMDTFHVWISTKADGRQSSRNWCRERFIQEQRLYELAKLRQQFHETLEGLGFHTDSHSASRDRDLHNGGEFVVTRSWAQNMRRKWERRERQRELRLSRMEMDRKKGTRMLRLEDSSSFRMISASSLPSKDDEDEINLHHQDFLISCDFDEFIKSSRRGTRMSKSETNVMKLVLFAGLYPNVAVMDHMGRDDSRKGASWFVHTATKPFAIVHPQSVYSNTPKIPLSHKECFCFQTLLETSKTHITNMCRVPALQSLLLFSRSVDVSADCLTVLIDDWLRFRFESPRNAESVLVAAFELRVALEGILLSHLQEKLQSKSKGEMVDMFGRSKDIGVLLREQYGFGMDGVDLDVFPSFFRKPLEWITGTSGFDWEIEELTEKLSEFLEFDISYRLDHPSPQDVISSFTNSEFLATFYEDGQSILDILEQSRNGTSHRFDGLKEGVKLAPFLRYRSISGSSNTSALGVSTDNENDTTTISPVMDEPRSQMSAHIQKRQDEVVGGVTISPMRMLEEKATKDKLEQKQENIFDEDHEEIHNLMLRGKPQITKFSEKSSSHSSMSCEKEDACEANSEKKRHFFVPRSERKHPR